ncbi:aminoglycoside phosphotransferase family protein [Roseiflexus castenholzii]|uniref:aminoglycoside phosphotransferase family protein n=1 Tax=Roseiflexus castenholzii TaxID=120962 RepID=UPI003C7E7625
MVSINVHSSHLAAFRRAIIELYGEAGSIWLAQLPSLLEILAESWSLTILPPFPNLTYHYVAPAIRDHDEPVILKVGVPNPELTAEIEVLRWYDGRGCARLIATDEARGALLIERLLPGTPLRDLEPDDSTILIAAEIMRHIWRPAPAEHQFPTTAAWGKGFVRMRRTFNGGSGPFPSALTDAAERLYAELDASSAPSVVLHGDLHQENVLTAQRAPWLAIDPKGVVGEPAYEVGALLRNPPSWRTPAELERLMARRIDLLAETLGFERERIAGWGLAQAVLSAWWSYKDHGHGWDEAIACAEALYRWSLL